MRFILRVEWQTRPVRVLCLQKTTKGKVREDEVHPCFIKFIRSLSVPSALWQQGQFGVWENSGKTRASVIFMLRTIDHKPSVWGDLHAGGFYFGQVCLAARAPDCKSGTSETPLVQLQPCPLSAPVSQSEEGAGLNPVQCEFESHREYWCLCSRTEYAPG